MCIIFSVRYLLYSLNIVNNDGNNAIMQYLKSIYAHIQKVAVTFLGIVGALLEKFGAIKSHHSNTLLV